MTRPPESSNERAEHVIIHAPAALIQAGEKLMSNPTPEPKPVCTAERPWKQGEPSHWHNDARIVGECREGCCNKYQCPHCGFTFLVELPD